MKKFITILSLALASTFAFSAETEKVCINLKVLKSQRKNKSWQVQ